VWTSTVLLHSGALLVYKAEKGTDERTSLLIISLTSYSYVTGAALVITGRVIGCCED
jgi:hypothetical protein